MGLFGKDKPNIQTLAFPGDPRTAGASPTAQRMGRLERGKPNVRMLALREDVEGLVDPLLRATRDPDHRVRAQAGWALDRIGTVAVTVGVSQLVRPMIQEAVSPGVGGRPALTDPTLAPPGGKQPDDPPILRPLARFLDRIEDVRAGDHPPAK